MSAKTAPTPATAERVLSLGESEALAASARRARQLDRELATALERSHRTGEVAPASIAALGRRPPLRRDQELALVRAAKAGDAQARAALVEAFLPEIVAEAHHYRSSSTLDRLELVQEGAVGLLQALASLDGEELEPEEIAGRLGLSTRRVQEIERRARAKLAAARARRPGQIALTLPAPPTAPRRHIRPGERRRR